MDQVKFFKSCLPQILLGRFLNTLAKMYHTFFNFKFFLLIKIFPPNFSLNLSDNKLFKFSWYSSFRSLKMANSYGSITWWGFSPAEDLMNVIANNSKDYINDEDINILLVGNADGRHIFKTLANMEASSPKVNFYIEEHSLELVARQMLFLKLIFEPSVDMGLQERCEVILELLGNSLIRTEVMEYVEKESAEFIKLITDPASLKEKYPWLDLSNLKFKEIDLLEGIFKFWKNKNTNIFDIRKFWEARCRQNLGSRYDSRENGYDRDYSMNLREKAPIISWYHYKEWRESGIAFCIRDKTAYETPNKTLASGLVFMKDGERIYRRGYWGDIMNSPYITYGAESDEESLFVKANNLYSKTETDVALHNINSVIQSANTEASKGKNFKNKNFKIIFLPLESISSLHRKSKFKEKFNLLYFSNSMVHCMDSYLQPLMKANSLIMVESTKFMLELKADLHKEYSKKIKSMAEKIYCHNVREFDAEKENFALFKNKN